MRFKLVKRYGWEFQYWVYRESEIVKGSWHLDEIFIFKMFAKWYIKRQLKRASKERNDELIGIYESEE